WNLSNRDQACLHKRANRRRHSPQVTWFAGGSAQPDFTPGSVEHRAMRQNGVTAWNTGLCASEYVTDALRSATNSRCTRVFEFAMVRLVPGDSRFGEAPSDFRSDPHWEIVAPNSINPHAHAIVRLDLSRKPRLACAMGNSTQDRTPDDLAAM